MGVAWRVYMYSSSSTERFLSGVVKSFESRLTIFLSYSFIQRVRAQARFQCLYIFLSGRAENGVEMQRRVGRGSQKE